MKNNMRTPGHLEVKFHEILQVWVIEDTDLRELLVHPDGHVLQFKSKQEAEKEAL